MGSNLVAMASTVRTFLLLVALPEIEVELKPPVGRELQGHPRGHAIHFHAH